MKNKCFLCNKIEVEEIDYKFKSSFINPLTNTNIIVDAKGSRCKSCKEEWLNQKQQDRIDINLKVAMENIIKELYKRNKELEKRIYNLTNK